MTFFEWLIVTWHAEQFKILIHDILLLSGDWTVTKSLFLIDVDLGLHWVHKFVVVVCGGVETMLMRYYDDVCLVTTATYIDWNVFIRMSKILDEYDEIDQMSTS